MWKLLIYLLPIILLPDVLIGLAHLRHAPQLWRILLLCVPTLVLLVLLLLQLLGVHEAWVLRLSFAIMLLVVLPKVVFLLVDGAGWLLGLACRQTVVAQWGTRVALVLAVALALVQTYGLTWGWQRLQTVRHDVPVAGLPQAFGGYRVVHLSDLHVGTFAAHPEFLERVVDSVNALRPDLILFTGDMVNHETDEIRPFLSTLSRLHAKDGVLSVLGNHDYQVYSHRFTLRQRAEQVQALIALQQSMGWTVLCSEHRAITRGTDTLYVAGVQNVSHPPYPSHGRLADALRGIPATGCTLLLTHDPWHWRHGVVHHTQVALTLSGHTHAMQFRVGSFSPVKWISPEWGGLYTQNRQRLFVSTGIGAVVPYRIGAWPQIDLLVLQPDK